MKQTRLLVLILLTIVGAVAAAVTPPTDLSLRGIVEWVGVGGHIASGTSTILPPVGAVGSRYTHLYNASKPIEYRSTGTAWRQMWTWNHSQLSNLEYVLSGHGIVPISYGGTGATNTVDARTNLDVFSTASTTALIDDLSGVTEVASARENIDVYSTEETNQLIAQTVALLRYYVSSEPTDLPGFGSLNSVASTTESSFTTPALTTTMTQVTQRITASGCPNISQTVAGIYPFSVNLQRSGGKLAYFQVALFKRDTGGSETHIASSSVYTLTDDLRKTVTLDLMAPSTVAWASTDRLVLRSYAAKESTGVAVDITFYYGDGNQSYITLSAGGGGVYARQDLHNVDPLTGRLALGFPDSTGKANYVLAVGTDTTTLYWSSVDALTTASVSSNIALKDFWISNDGDDEGIKIGSSGNVLVATSTDDGSNVLQIAGFSKFGEAAPGIKFKSVYLTVPASISVNIASVPHGLDASKILWMGATVWSASEGVGLSSPAGGGYWYAPYYTASDVCIKINGAVSSYSEAIQDCPVKVTLIYSE